MDGWNTIVSFWDAIIFGGELLVSGRVYNLFYVKLNTVLWVIFFVFLQSIQKYYHVVWVKLPTIFQCNANVAFPSCFALLKFTALVEQRLTKISSEILIVVAKSLRVKSVRKCIKLLLMAEILHHLGWLKPYK